jgi:hypothetical protein
LMSLYAWLIAFSHLVTLGRFKPLQLASPCSMHFLASSRGFLQSRSTGGCIDRNSAFPMDKPGEVNRVAKHPMKHTPSKTSLTGSESMMIVAE